MDAVLLGITVVSLVVALVMSLVAWRMARAERWRSTARVAALSMDAAAAGPVAPRAAAQPATATASRAPWTPAPVLSQPARAPRPRATDLLLRPGAPVAELPLHPAPAAASRTMPDGFLSASPAAGGSRQRGLAVAASVLMVALLVLGASMFAGPASPGGGPLSGDAALELMSLRHDQTGNRLEISGLVKNPSAGRAVDRLDAVVFLFDQAGTFVKSAVAPVDFRHLAAGDESPFVVTLEAPAGVARYRVSFRTPDGAVPHIDRRAAPPALETRR